MSIMLETDSLILRTADTAFADDLLAYYQRNQAFLAPFEPRRGAAFYTLDTQREQLRQDIAALESRTTIRFYLFLQQAPQQLIGSIALSNIVWGCFLSCFLGYKLDGDYTNNGYMTQAIKAVSRYAFDTLRLHRIEANVIPRNLPSRRALEKCGFYNEGLSKSYLKINGVWEDHIHMVLLNDAV